MDMDLDALLLEEDSDAADDASSTCYDSVRSASDDDAASVTTKEPIRRIDSPCSVENVLEPPPPPPPRAVVAVAAVPAAPTDRRRVRHRESMARYRRELRDRVDALQTQQTALQRIFHQVLAHKKPIFAASGTRSQLQQLQAEFTEVVRIRETLMRENRELSDQVYAFDQRLGAFQSMLDHSLANATPLSEMPSGRANTLTAASQVLEQIAAREADLDRQQRMRIVWDDDSDRSDETGSRGYWLEFLPQEPPLFYESESHASSGAIIRAGLDALDRTRELHPVNGRPRLQMRFTRRVPRSVATLQEIQDRTWTFLNSPELIARVNNSTVTAKVAQQLNDDTIILLRNSPDKFGHKRFRYFSLNARMWSAEDGSALVLMLVLDKEAEPMRPLDGEDNGLPPLRWMKQGGSSLRFSPVDDGTDTVEIEYTGFIESLTDEHAVHLMVANCSALLRWEHLVVPPRLLL